MTKAMMSAPDRTSRGLRRSTIRRLTAVLAAAALTLGVAVSTGTPALAGTGLYYQAVDADNDPYSGIYLRNGTSMGNVDRVYHRYLYYGNTVELICGAWGEAVGPYNNRRWHYVHATNGPAAGQQGWIADRYLNTPNKANEYTPGEPECGAPPPPTYNGSVYFEANGSGDESSPASVHRSFSHWTASDCSSVNANNFPSWLSASNTHITTAAGWSLGRLGPVYTLETTQGNPGGGRWQELDYILLLDPGNDDDLLVNSCDTRDDRGQLFTKWLKANPNAKLVILAGQRTGEDSHRGIQTLYFDYLRANGGPRDRILVCNYDGMGHQAVYSNFKDAMNTPPALPLDQHDCPGTESWAWHP
ncbi:hypothetical protein [Micromonospora sp. DH14]|uniref:hypothetical protein n=1 Tax=Micromonospora sp. DH14 TaxID=3040120 RepID=UPI0024420062|nr:hypothetical protein [Micromonospora sp. DH14]MDG9674093.1 hypothetical protein [Micromonospora sp. DH14]